MTTLIPLALLSLAASQPQQTGHVVVTRENLVRIVESQIAHGELLPCRVAASYHRPSPPSCRTASHTRLNGPGVVRLRNRAVSPLAI